MALTFMNNGNSMIVIVFSIMCECHSNPVDLRKLNSDLDTYKYLERFGYLGQSSGASESLYREDAVEHALKELQRYGNIAQTGMLDSATIQLMKTPRCGVKDVPKHGSERRRRYVLGPNGWNKRNITYFVANWTPKLSEDVVGRDMQRAFDTWAGFGNLNFKRVWSPDADIIIGFGSGYHGDYYPFDGQGNILAHAYYPYEMGAYGGDIHFDDDEQWTTGDDYNPENGDVDFFSVAVHELGHSLGLAHSPVPGSVMYPFYRWTRDSVQLAYDDILAMHELYISRIIKEPSTQAPESNDVDQYDDTDLAPVPSTTARTTTSTKPTTTTSAIPRTTIRPYSTTTFTYDGDYETVEDHMNHDKDQPKNPKPDPASDLCSGNIDAIALIRDELFVFKNQFLWRMQFVGQYSSQYPIRFRELFTDLPASVKSIDAAYERPVDSAIILFSGKKYWVFDGNKFIDSPRPLTDYGISDTVEKIDAVQVWKKNGKTYLYSGSEFWRFDESTRTLDNGYPKSMDRWRGVPTNLDAALTWINGLTYFFKGRFVWRFDNYWIRVDEAFPQPSVHHWFGCPHTPDTQYLVL